MLAQLSAGPLVKDIGVDRPCLVSVVPQFNDPGLLRIIHQGCSLNLSKALSGPLGTGIGPDTVDMRMSTDQGDHLIIRKEQVREFIAPFLNGAHRMMGHYHGNMGRVGLKFPGQPFKLLNPQVPGGAPFRPHGVQDIEPDSSEIPRFQPIISIHHSSPSGSANRSLDSLMAERMSFVVALVWMPGTSNGDFLLFLKRIEKVSPPLLLITTSSLLAVFRTSERRCLASEYVYTFMITYPKIAIPISRAAPCIPRSSVSSGLRRFSAHSKK